MNLQQKYLLLFSDFREQREECTRLGDEVVRLRAQLEEERSRFDALTDRYISREEKLNDRMLGERFAPRPPAEPRPQIDPNIQNPKQWVQQQKSKFAQQLAQRAADIASDNRTNTTHPN